MVVGIFFSAISFISFLYLPSAFNFGRIAALLEKHFPMKHEYPVPSVILDNRAAPAQRSYMYVTYNSLHSEVM